MKTITGLVMISALVVPSTPAAAQGNLEHQIERIVDSALALAADALDDFADNLDRDRDDRQQRSDRARGDRGPEFNSTFTKTVRLGRNGRFELDSVSGDVEITGVSGDDVKITATKSVHSANETSGRAALDATEIQVNERPGVVTVAARPTQGRSNGASVDYVIAMPTGTGLTLRTVSGDVTVKNIAGDIRVRSLSGDVVIADGKPNTVEVEVTSGDISLEQIDAERVQVRTVSGDVILKGRLSKTGRYSLNSHSGDIQVISDSGASFDVDATTFSGDVSSDFALTRGVTPSNLAPSPRGPQRNTSVSGRVKDGGAVLSLQSFSGDILISKR